MSSLTTEFVNTPFLDYSDPSIKQQQQSAIDAVRAKLGRTYPLIIGGAAVTSDQTFTSINPARPDEVVGIFPKATTEQALAAIAAAETAFKTWQYVSPDRRAEYLLAAAQKLTERRMEFNAWLIFETGKSWVEADVEVAEGIDFLNFYAREMHRLAQPQPLTRLPGEENDLKYIPLGVGVVIPPWNFPLAIMGGMTTASIVAGNTVVLKPASTAATIAANFVNLLGEVGVPAGVINFLPGPGGTIGDALVADARTRFIAFTGSRDVGLHINQLAATPQPGQIWIKRTVLEMGGKDAVVVDETADLDAAAAGIVASAFGYQGQKCSAGSRAIIVSAVYDQILPKIVERAKVLAIGDPDAPTTNIGPVIDANAFKKIREYIEIGRDEGQMELGGGDVDRQGYYIPPTIISGVAPTARIAQEEIFGPVLAVIKAQDFDDALAIANGTEYGLTGSLYTKDRTRMERAAREFHVGNLYFNRKSTGAMVGAHPFGGFNMSGTDSKAGGRDYLLLFTQAKVVTEKVS
ncbi:MAG: L-glutamate gamma-semialdehyde dehydrogenase [Ktedonobacterales bacterium]|nr:L-glutamate gamma-semialdehyde dehydrogenase [Ktedonobacterales bacterium]